MSLKISHHKLEGVDYIASPNTGGIITPRFGVMHYTAGYTALSAINTLKSPAAKVSAHLVIATDGKITQMVPFNKAAWHAGPSRFEGFTNLNSHSIGFEFVNIGWLRKTLKGYQDAFGNLVNVDQFEDLVEFANPRVGSGTLYWPAYPKAQIDAGIEIAKALVDKYGLQDFLTHEEIDTRGWKTDPGPAFPMKSFEHLLVGGRQTPADVGKDRFIVTTASLNVRGGAGVQWPIIGKLVANDEIREIDRVGDWAFVEFKPGEEGWVSTAYIRAK